MRNIQIDAQFQSRLELIEKLSSVTKPDWIPEISREIHKKYRELRENIIINRNTWNYFEYRFRFATHYYNIAVFLFSQFKRTNVNIELIRVCTEKCLSTLGSNRQTEREITKTDDLFKKATLFKQAMDKVYIQFENKLNSTRNRKLMAKTLLNLGHVDFENFDFSDENLSEFRTHVLGIHLMNFISDIEEILTLHQEKDHYSKSTLCIYIARAYRICGQQILHDEYMLRASKQVTLAFAKLGTKDHNPELRKKVRNSIRQQVQDHESKLLEIYKVIKEDYTIELNTLDCIYVERKYIKYCIESFSNNIHQILIRMADTDNEKIFLYLLSNLENIKTITDLPDQFTITNRYYSLLLEHKHILRKDQHKKIIKDFKQNVWKIISPKISEAQNELDVLKHLIVFFRSINDIRTLLYELQIGDFCNKKLPIQNFIANILNLDIPDNEELQVLKYYTEIIKDKTKLFFIDKFVEVLESYAFPPDPVIEGEVMTLKAKLIILSEVMENATRKKTAEIKELRIVGADILFINESLKNEIWSGVNVLVISKIIHVQGEQLWDVTGRDGENYPTNAENGVQRGDDGKNGKNGQSGSSGGNVHLSCTSILNSGDLTIKSNGGRGGAGQNGGNGAMGEDGTGIEYSEFENLISPPEPEFSYVKEIVRIWWSIIERVPVLNINTPLDLLTYIAELERRGRNIPEIPLPKVSKKVQIFDASWTQGSFRFNFWDNASSYFTGSTENNCEITYSYYPHWIPSKQEVLILYQGTNATLGGQGGKGGAGGPGGFPGDVKIKCGHPVDILKVQDPVVNGGKGSNGSTGRPGINGWDMGLVFVNGVFSATKKIKGKNQDLKLELKYHNSRKDDEFVYVPYQYEHLNNYNYYAELKSRQSDTNVVNRNMNRSSDQREEEQHKATRCKAISTQVIDEFEEISQSDIIDELVDLTQELETLKEQALEEIVEKDEEKETEMTNFQFHRQAVFDDSALQKQRKILKKRPRNTPQLQVNSEVNDIIQTPTNINSWFRLKHVVVNFVDLQKMFDLLHRNKDSIGSHFSEIYNLLLAKYKFAICQEIDRLGKLPDIDVFFNPEPIENYLVADANIEEFTHDHLGILQEYFQPDNKDLLPGLQNYLKSADLGKIMYPLKFFIMEKSYKDQTFKGYVQDVSELLEKFEKKLEILIKCYLAAYEKDSNSSMLIHIEKRKNIIIQDFKDKIDFEYVLSEFTKYISEIGISSTAVRELLACAFDVNIQIFLLTNKKEFILYHNHNPTAKNTNYLFLINGQFVPFHINKNFVNLISQRKKDSKNYSDILDFVNEFVCKKDFDEFYRNFSQFKGYESKTQNYLKYRRMTENELIDKICVYFPPDDFCEIHSVISKLKVGYIQNKNILMALLQRFETEGLHLLTHEMIYIVNTILNSYIEKNSNLELFEWILHAKPQSSWINEIFCIELENYFKKSLISTNIPRNVRNIKQKDMILLMDSKIRDSFEEISLQCITTCVEILSEIEIDEELIKTLPISKWQYTLREQWIEYQLRHITSWDSTDELQKALYYLNCLETNSGSLLIDLLLGILDTRKDELTSRICLDLFSLLHLQEWSLDEVLLNKISEYGIANIKKELIQAHKKIDEERTLATILKLIENNSHTSNSIRTTLKEIEKLDILLMNDIDNPYTESALKLWADQIRTNISTLQKKDRKKFIKQNISIILTHILHAIKLKKGFSLRRTQRLAILLMLSHNRNILSQISTGEGKSLIVVAVSIFKAICGEKVDVITSSSVLAIRDATIHKDIYDIFGIGVNHNCSEKISERRDVYSACQVIFGDLSNFQRDFLLDRFYGKNILGNRTFDTLIVDEVDSMLLDKGNNTLYLSHDIPGLDKLESVYQFIWKRICMSAGKKIEDFETHLKKEVLFDLYGTIDIDDLETHLQIPKQTATILHNFLKMVKVLDQKNIVQKNVDDFDVSKLSNELKLHVHKLRFIINKILKRQTEIRIPKCLYKFVENHAETWIKNGLLAISMEEGIDYVVDVDRTQTKADVNPNITIIDKGTGTDQSNSQWEEALHQFLQLKHGCKVSSQSLKAVFISNVSYFKEYTKLFGLTGTLGSQVERDLLKNLYDVEFVNIPTAKPKRFLEQEPILCCTETDWQFRIVNRTKELTSANRSVLIICETIKEVNILTKAFQNAEMPNKKIYKREYEECLLAQGKEKLDGGCIIIATNLAGRGTDIKITDDLNKNGGLHVLLTYLPTNARIEWQAFGRAARSGCNGSGQLIIIGYGSFLDKRAQREDLERQRIADIKVYFDSRIQIEEKYFKKFSKVYKNCITSYLQNFTDNELKEIASQRLLDRWAFWIDEFGSKLNDRNIDKNFDVFEKNIKNNFTKWDHWTEDPIQLVKVGLNYINKKSYKKAIKVFDAVINTEPLFCEAAHYFKALAIVSELDFEKRPFSGKNVETFNQFVAELRNAERIFESHRDACISSSAFIQNLKQNMKNSFMTIDAYKSQQETLMTLYELYIRSINDILGHSVTKTSFISQEINQAQSEDIYNSFLERYVLKRNKIVKANIKDIEEIAADFGISPDPLLCFIQSFEGEENIEEQFFLRKLKKRIDIPNLEECWEMLIQEEKLINEFKFVIIEKSKLTTIQEGILDGVPKAAINVKRSAGKYVFMKQCIIQNELDLFIIERKELKLRQPGLYQTLKNDKLMKFNRRAELNIEKLSEPINKYDRIKIQHIMSDNIIRGEAKNIMKILTEKGFLAKQGDTYTLIKPYDESKIPKISTYNQSVLQILRINFSYRILLQNLQNDLKNPEDQVFMKLISEPHTTLMWELVAKKIFEPVCVANHKSNEIRTILNTYGNNDDEKKSINNHVERVLEKLAGSVKSLDVPSFKLQPVRELIDDLQVSNLQELQSFETNGLEFIINTEEKKYTTKMILSTIFVAILGILEIAAGLAIQLFFAGTLSHLGNMLLSEGVSDLSYSVSCLWTGYFDWSDYGQYKYQSVMQSFLFCCGAAVMSQGATLSKFGNKLALSGIVTETGKEVAELAGKELIKEVGAKAVAKEFGKQFIHKVGEGIVRGAVNEGMNRFVDSYLQNLCNQLSNSLVGDIEKKVNAHDINMTLLECYRVFGPKESKNKIKHYTEIGFSQPVLTNTILAKATEITSQISSVCAEASKRGVNMPYAQYISYLGTVLSYDPYRRHIDDITSTLQRVLDTVNVEMQREIQAARGRGVREINCTNNEQQTFKNEVICQWRQMTQQRASSIFTERLAKPILRDCSFSLLQKGKENIKKLYNFTRNSYHKHIYESAKRKKEKLLQDNSISEETRSKIVETYNETIIQLQKNVRDPTLYAELVQEGNGYMDAICLKAGSNMIEKLKGDDQRPVKLKVKTECGSTVEYCTPGVGECREINLNLQDKHFESTTNEDSSYYNDCDCLYRAISKEFPEMQSLSVDQFRKELGTQIKENKEINDDIRKGRHAFTIRKRIYGGYRKENIATNQLRDGLMQGKYFLSQSSVSERTQDLGLEKGVHMVELVDSLSKKFDEDKIINAVEIDCEKGSKYIFLDNRRIVAASTINNPDVNVLVRVFKYDEVLPSDLQRQYSIKTPGKEINVNTAGFAAEIRIQRSRSFGKEKPRCTPYSPSEVRLRPHPNKGTIGNERINEFYRRIEDVGFIKHRRSNSVDRGPYVNRTG